MDLRFTEFAFEFARRTEPLHAEALVKYIDIVVRRTRGIVVYGYGPWT